MLERVVEVSPYPFLGPLSCPCRFPGQEVAVSQSLSLSRSLLYALGGGGSAGTSPSRGGGGGYVLLWDTVEAWHPRPFCGLRGSKEDFLAWQWHEWALAVPCHRR